MSAIKLNIQRLLKERGWSIMELERKAGTEKKHNIQNVLRGVSRNPSIELTQAIANAFNIDIKELLKDPHQQIPHIRDFALFNNICAIVTRELRAQSSEISIDKLFTIIKEVYVYSTKFEPITVEEKFVKWTVMKELGSKIL